ncbi:hypothetical protein SAMN02745157_2363 [Kaistia soli DSM 19436]|uniref:Uncharacterized protein n=1 Tax=Kaistia soli DSM 19436 TaxID=1122133 RepID=A0A1M5CIA8_9HYPH|nr:hypothetical protein [Kaistia soli]SHF54449.1 hypothetical protein SAMN02745157_2363 [Kaistia soli DSM 19436]
MPDDYSAPLGLDRPAARRRPLPIWPFLAGPTLLIVAAFAAWAVLKGDPYGGQPHVTVDVPPLPPPVAAAPPQPEPPAEPDDPNGQIIIRDP